MGKTTPATPNVRAAESDAPKDNPTPEEIKAADDAVSGEGKVETPPEAPQEPLKVTEESEEETADRHIASSELPVGELLPEELQADTPEAEVAKELIVPGAAAGPERDGTVRNDMGRVAWAPPGSYNAAMNGVQEDASGHVDSVGTDNSSKSGTRI